MTESLQTLLSELERFGEANDNATADRSGRMLNVTRDTGEFLSVLVQATAARRVLEIGTSNGYSTLWLASAAGTTGGAVTTVELSDYKVGLARHNFSRSGLEAVLAEADAWIEMSGAKSYAPFLHVERAELARLSDEDMVRQREYREAHRVFLEIGAPIRAAEVAKECDS